MNMMKTKFNSDNELRLNKTIEIPAMTIVARAIFHENNKYFPQVFRWISVQNIKMLYYDRIDVSRNWC